MGALAIIFWIIGLFVLYTVIKWAIDGSETAENIREIRNILSMQYPNEAQGADTEPDEKLEETNYIDDECPACHSKVSETDSECPSCGLILKG